MKRLCFGTYLKLQNAVSPKNISTQSRFIINRFHQTGDRVIKFY